ncbi:MAG TPA: hypothetical protein VMW74_07305 [Nitrosopumilaceae archaeon]|nr:hypothetical protein [Nitrosopumilaceae archaeon]
MNKKFIFIIVGITVVIFGIYISIINEPPTPTSANLLVSGQLSEPMENYILLPDTFIEKYSFMLPLLEEEKKYSSNLETTSNINVRISEENPSIHRLSLEEAYELQTALNQITKINGKEGNPYFVIFQDYFYRIGIDFCTPTCGPYL